MPSKKGSHEDPFLRQTSAASKPQHRIHCDVRGETVEADEISLTRNLTRIRRDLSRLTPEPTVVEGCAASLSPSGQVEQRSRLLLSMDTVSKCDKHRTHGT